MSIRIMTDILLSAGLAAHEDDCPASCVQLLACEAGGGQNRRRVT